MKNPTNSRLACWSILLQDFDFDVIHRPGRVHSNVDALSRIRLPGREDEERAIERLESSLNPVRVVNEDEDDGTNGDDAMGWEPA